MYDIYKSYEDNYENGPFQNFLNLAEFPKIIFEGEAQFSFLDEKFHIPFGVPAGPLLNSKYVNCALNAGFCFPIYKTVRSQFYKSHPFPNMVKIISETESLFATNKNVVVGNLLTSQDLYSRQLSISNSFGVPSQSPEVWKEDFQKCIFSKSGSRVGLSFQGTNPGTSWAAWKHDFVKTATLVCETLQGTNQKFAEVNLSCPNENAVPLYHDFLKCKELLQEISQVTKKSGVKLIAKIGVLDEETCKKWVCEIPEYIDALSLINTVSCEILDVQGKIILGSKLSRGGVCGNLIRNQSLKMMEMFANHLEKNKVSKNRFGLIGVGGITQAQHVQDYLNAGAHLTQSATGMMWNLNLAAEVSDLFRIKYKKDALVTPQNDNQKEDSHAKSKV